MAKTAVVILNYNGEDFLRQFLPSVIEHSPEAEVIVADNASTDGSVSLLQDTFPQVRLILMDVNLGYAGGYNEALVELDHEYCVLLNSDIEVTANWIEPIVNYMDQHPDVAACQPKIMDFHNRNKFEYAGASGGHLDILGYPYCRGRVFDTLESDQGQYDAIGPIAWATGACMFVRTAAFKAAGGFDKDFFAHMEEIDLCWRFRLMGYKLFSIPESHIFHVGGGTLSKINPRKTYLNFRNNLSLLFKNETFGRLVWKLPVKWLLDWAAALKFLLGGSLGHALAIIQAQWAFLTLLGKNLNKRGKVRQLRKVSVNNSKFLLPFEYFVKRRKTFSQLHPNS